MSGNDLGIQGFTADDKPLVAGSRFSVVRDAIFANPYQQVWGANGNAPFERFEVTLAPLTKGQVPGGEAWHFLEAAKRVLASDSDLRWGPDGKGYRRLLHANGSDGMGLAAWGDARVTTRRAILTAYLDRGGGRTRASTVLKRIEEVFQRPLRRWTLPVLAQSCGAEVEGKWIVRRPATARGGGRRRGGGGGRG